MQKKCKVCGIHFQATNPIQVVCGYACGYKYKNKHIKKISIKRASKSTEYNNKRLKFLEGKYCPITKQPATEIHHKYSGANRHKYYLDESTWVAVSREGHQKIHNNPLWAKKMGYLK